MKILKIFGVVVGIHVFALMLIFANPGCSSTNQPAPSASDTVVPAEPSPAAASHAADASPIVASPGYDSLSAPPASFDPNAPAGGVRFSPTRPGSAAAGALDVQPVSDVTPATTYTATKGDSLWTIAKKHHLTVSELAAANNLKAGTTVRLGQKLIIPNGVGAGTSSHVADTAAPRSSAPSALPAAAPATKATGDSVHHVVKPGETLGAIARKYQVKVGEVAMANNISDPAKIRPGMELIIPGWQSPTAKSGKAAARPKAEAAPVPATPAPTIPPPEQDLDAGLRAGGNEPPVIQVQQTP